MTELIQKVRQKAELETRQAELLQEQKRLEKEVFDLQITAHNEQVDAEKLEGFSVEGLFLKMTGRYEEKLEAEQREARTAKTNHALATARLELVNTHLRQIASALAPLDGCEYALAAVLANQPGYSCTEEEKTARALETAIKTGASLEDSANALQAALDTAQAWLSARSGKYLVISELHQAENRVQAHLNTYIKILAALQQQLTALECPLNIQQSHEFRQDYLLGTLTDVVVNNRFLTVQQHLVQILRQWHRLEPALKERLGNARIAWMQALCCAGMA